ncbi:MAG: hypothetical protein R3B45_14740 [Bdellovibrionota bacterium]
MKHLMLFIIIMSNYYISCIPNRVALTIHLDQFTYSNPKYVQRNSIEAWLNYNHHIRNLDKPEQLEEFNEIKEALQQEDSLNNQLKYVVIVTNIEASQDEMIRAKGILNTLIKKELVVKNFWELYGDKLNSTIHFEKTSRQRQEKYKETLTAKNELEKKIKELSEIEQEALNRSDGNNL